MPAATFKKSNKSDDQSTGGTFVKGDGYAPAPDGAILPVIIEDMRYKKVNKEKTPWKKSEAEIAFQFKAKGGGVEPAGGGEFKELGEKEFRNRKFWYDLPYDMSEGSWLSIAIREIIGFDDLPEDFVFDTDELDEYIGWDVRIRVNQYTTGEKSKEPGVVKNSVQEILRPLAQPFSDEDNPF